MMLMLCCHLCGRRDASFHQLISPICPWCSTWCTYCIYTTSLLLCTCDTVLHHYMCTISSDLSSDGLRDGIDTPTWC